MYALIWCYPNQRIILHKLLQPVSGDAIQSVLMTGLGLVMQHAVEQWLSDDRNNSIFTAEDSAWPQDYWQWLAPQGPTDNT